MAYLPSLIVNDLNESRSEEEGNDAHYVSCGLQHSLRSDWKGPAGVLWQPKPGDVGGRATLSR